MPNNFALQGHHHKAIGKEQVGRKDAGTLWPADAQAREADPERKRPTSPSYAFAARWWSWSVDGSVLPTAHKGCAMVDGEESNTTIGTVKKKK